MNQDDFLAQLEMRSVAERYFSAVDSSDGELMASCFARDFRLELDMRPTRVLATAQEVTGFLNEGWRPAASTHVLGNMHVVMNAGKPRSTINAVVHVMMEAGGPIMLRGLRYTDLWTLQDGNWLIAERVHKLRWMGAAEAARP